MGAPVAIPDTSEHTVFCGNPTMNFVLLLAACQPTAALTGRPTPTSCSTEQFSRALVACRSAAPRMDTASGAESRAHDDSSEDEVPRSLGGSDSDWRVERARLDHQRSKQLRARPPRYPPFAISSNIVQTLGLSTRDEWLEHLELGEGRSPYVPTDPETYYTQRGEWLGWRAWLTGSPV